MSKRTSFTHKEEIELETTQPATIAKLPMLKMGDYEWWRLRNEQYFQVQDYALWDVIENSNSFVPVTQSAAEGAGSSTTISKPVTAEDKLKKNNDVKARSLLLMALPNEHQLTFNQYKDAKTLFAAIKARFGESFDSIFNRLQKLVSQLAIFGVKIPQEDLNSKLRCLPFEWNTHVVVWRNKPDLDTMSIDDLYNNFKIVEQEVKGTATLISTANLSDATVYAFLANQSNLSQLVHEDLKQIHEDDLEEMDLKWQLALLSMRAKRFFQKAGKKITINGSDTDGYDKSKVECFNCHKLGHFSMECIGSRNQDSRNRNQDSSRRTVNVEETSSKSMLAIDGVGFYWSYMVEEEVPTNLALMAFSDSEVHNNNTCSKTCLKSYKTLKKQYDDLRIDFNKVEFDLVVYKKGLASIEEQLVFYKNNESTLCENIVILTRDMMIKDSKISMLKSELEKVKHEKEGIKFKIDNFDNASKSLDKLLGSQITDKSKHGLGFVNYNVVSPLATLVYNTGRPTPPTVDLSYSGLEEFKQPEFEGYGPKSSEIESQNVSEVNEPKENSDVSLVKEQVSDDLEKKIVSPTASKGHPQQVKEDQGYVDSGCSRHMTGNMSYLTDFKEYDEGYVSFRGGANGGRITGKGTIKTGNLDFEDLPDESQILLRVPRKNNMYSVDMRNIIPKESLTCLVAKATLDESLLWHRRLGHINFKNINKLVKDNLMRGLPSKCFENDQTCVACLKGKQHKASCILKEFITGIENLVKRKVKVIRCDNGTEFKNSVMNEFCVKKARTMLADSKLPTTFWAKAVNTACYVQNKALVVKHHNKTPYEIFEGRKPALSFMKPFGCHVTILNTLDDLGKFDGKSNEGFFVGYSLNSKAFRVYNIRTRKVEESLHIDFLENKPIIAGDGPKWLFDIDMLTKSRNYVQVIAGTDTNNFADGSPLFGSSPKNSSDDTPTPSSDANEKGDEGFSNDNDLVKENSVNSANINTNSTNSVSIVSLNINTVSPNISTAKTDELNVAFKNLNTEHPDDPKMPGLEYITTYDDSDEEADFTNLEFSIHVSPIPTTKIHKDHPLKQVIGRLHTPVQTRSKSKSTNEQGFISAIYEGKTHKDLNTCLFACFLLQIEPTRVAKALSDPA
ncbi:ribonuclease H-like domain-containing protein [Tanacetum coccineum]